METTIPVLDKRCLVLGVSGGIAAYKAADLASRLVQAGAEVEVVMTPAAAEFVRPLTFQALTQRPVATEMFSLLQDREIGHVALGKRAALMIVAPATANTLARLACGLADNLLVTTALACRGPLLLAPAMESGMWDHPATRANLATLVSRGAFVVGPEKGRLASGGVGEGRMAEPGTLLEAACWVLGRSGPLAGKRVVVTAGGTREPIDPVRFIGNRSSGRMGLALARAARDRGAHVTLIHGPLALEVPYGVEAVAVGTAAQMKEAVLEACARADVLLMAAAVADYRPRVAAEQKIKKEAESARLELVRTEDILSLVGERRRGGQGPAVVVGFAAETEELLQNARQKLEKKGLDLIVANDVSAPGSGFEAETNRVAILDPRGGVETLPLLAKREVAEAVLDRILPLLASR
ncbi:MAG: bifunctional phosphopantothenoylcysteine decarboxylase/phosphopantothenate--cysteine ligase CoaBC [Desulfobacterales bacterium]